MNRIVVGIDGSENAQAALAWALDEARRRGCPLHIVLAYEVPVAMAIPGAMTTMVPPELFQQRGEGLLETAVGAAIDPATETVPVTKAAVSGHAGKVLIEAAEGADLLVVARRGMGGFLGLHLGSVSNYCIHHSPCPVAVIPAQHHK